MPRTTAGWKLARPRAHERGSYKYVEDTDGDDDAKVSWGWQGDASSFIAAASYQHRSELRVPERDFCAALVRRQPVDSYIDTRSLLDPTRNVFTPRAGNVIETGVNEGPLAAGVTRTNARGLRIGSYTTVDLTYVLQLPGETTLSASAADIADQDPPLARLELSHDPTVVSPLGRTVEVGFGKKF